jgi:hypothetical protein
MFLLHSWSRVLVSWLLVAENTFTATMISAYPSIVTNQSLLDIIQRDYMQTLRVLFKIRGRLVSYSVAGLEWGAEV